MEKQKKKEKCLYCKIGVWDNEILSEYDLEQFPTYYKDDWKMVIGLCTDWLDKKIMPHKRFKYCPECGYKIDFRKIRRRLEGIDEYYGV